MHSEDKDDIKLVEMLRKRVGPLPYNGREYLEVSTIDDFVTARIKVLEEILSRAFRRIQDLEDRLEKHTSVGHPW